MAVDVRHRGDVAPGPGTPPDHACHAFGDPGEFARAVASFARVGELVGERVVVVDRVAAAEGFGDPAAPDAADRAVAAVVDQAHQAVADGHTGLRIAADCTDLVAALGGRQGFARYEHLMDCAVAGSGVLRALCGYDAGVLGPEVLAELAALHPEHVGVASSFHLLAAPGGRLVLRGTVDHHQEELFQRVLLDALPPIPSPTGADPLVIDARALEFVDHRALAGLDRVAGACATPVRLWGARPVIGRLGELLSLEHVAVAPDEGSHR